MLSILQQDLRLAKIEFTTTRYGVWSSSAVAWRSIAEKADHYKICQPAIFRARPRYYYSFVVNKWVLRVGRRRPPERIIVGEDANQMNIKRLEDPSPGSTS